MMFLPDALQNRVRAELQTLMTLEDEQPCNLLVERPHDALYNVCQSGEKNTASAFSILFECKVLW